MRKITLKEQDRFAFTLTGDSKYLQTEISEVAISSFCQGCDHAHTKICTVAGKNDQARYARNEWCGWAMQDGERKVKTG